MQAISAARTFSDTQVNELRERLQRDMPADSRVVTCGSYARRDASKSSDLDYFCLVPPDQLAGEQPFEGRLREIVKEVVGKPPSKGGAFATNTSRSELLSNIGGSSDSNDNPFIPFTHVSGSDLADSIGRGHAGHPRCAAQLIEAGEVYHIPVGWSSRKLLVRKALAPAHAA
jgi:predicted nucleotidyltransferase